MSDDSFDRRAFGEEIARLRTRKRWSRADLLDLIGHDECLTNETSIKRLENGEIIKLPYITVHRLSKALECTEKETSNLFYLSGKNIFKGSSGNINVFMQELHFIVFNIIPRITSTLYTIISNSNVNQLPKKDIRNILRTIIITIMKEDMENDRD